MLSRCPYLSFIPYPNLYPFNSLSISIFFSFLSPYLSHSQVLQFVLNTFRNFIFEPSSRLFTLSSLIELSIFLHSPTTVKSLHSSVFYYSPSFADLESLPSPSLHFPLLPFTSSLHCQPQSLFIFSGRLGEDVGRQFMLMHLKFRAGAKSGRGCGNIALH